MMTLKVGDRVLYKNVGYGLTTYDRSDDVVLDIRDGKLYTECFEVGMDWDDRTGTYSYNGGLGLTTYAIPGDDPAGLAWLAEESE